MVTADGWKDVAELQHKAFKISIKIDSSKCWRIYVEKNDQMKIMPYDIPETDPYYYCGNDSAFHLDNFPLGLWNYGDCIGLDSFPYAEKTKYNYRKEKIWTENEIKELARQLVDDILAYQVNFKMINEFRRLSHNVDNINSVANEVFKNKKYDELVTLNTRIESLEI